MVCQIHSSALWLVIKDDGLILNYIDFFWMTGFKLLSLYKLFFLLWFFIQMLLLGRSSYSLTKMKGGGESLN